MSYRNNKEQAEKQRALDRYELGPVEHVNDLTPETQVGETRKATESARIVQPNSSGYFETEAGNLHGLGAPLHLNEGLRHDGSPFVGQYEGAYNAYAMPLRSTLRALGRIKDVSLTGGPTTPEELKQRPELLARFRKLSATHGDVSEENAYHDWSTAQTSLEHSVEWFQVSQHEFPEVIANYRRAQQLLEQRKLQKLRDSKAAEAKAIEEVAHTIGRIIEVVAVAWSVAGASETLIGATELDTAAAEGVTGAEEAAGAEVASAGEVEKAGSLRSRGQRAFEGASRIANDGRAIISHAKKQLGDAGNVELSFESILIHFVDGEKYATYKRDMVKLDAEIALLGLAQEQELVHSATAQLKRMKLEFRARVRDVQSARVAARRGAKTYAKAMGADMPGIAAMYAAEAYQELAAFGRVAAQQRAELVDPLWGKVKYYLNERGTPGFAMLQLLDEARVLADNVKAVGDQRAYFDHQLPQWEGTAKQWKDFLADRAGSPLIAEPNDADRKSEAP